jgi:hypothetical protein
VRPNRSRKKSVPMSAANTTLVSRRAATAAREARRWAHNVIPYARRRGGQPRGLSLQAIGAGLSLPAPRSRTQTRRTVQDEQPRHIGARDPADIDQGETEQAVLRLFGKRIPGGVHHRGNQHGRDDGLSPGGSRRGVLLSSRAPSLAGPHRGRAGMEPSGLLSRQVLGHLAPDGRATLAPLGLRPRRPGCPLQAGGSGTLGASTCCRNRDRPSGRTRTQRTAPARRNGRLHVLAVCRPLSSWR